MKLRINNNSLRLRLSRSDVERLMLNGVVEESTLLGGAIPFRYRLALDPQANDVRTGRINNGIVVRVPAGVATMWASSDQIGIAAMEIHAEGTRTSVLIEKDFTCLNPRPGESQQDMFPRPDSGLERAILADAN